MLTSLKLTNFRSFRSFSIDKLARVNLFVGVNNAGKTCLLDATELLLSSGNPYAIWRGARRRGETFHHPGLTRELANISHLFHGHVFEVGARFTLEGEHDGAELIACEVVAPRLDPEPIERAEPSPRGPRIDPAGMEDSPALTLHIGAFGKDRSAPHERWLKLSSFGDVVVQHSTRSGVDILTDSLHPIHFLGTESFDAVHLSKLWDKLILTPEEGSAIDALQIIEPAIERIAFTGHAGQSEGRFFLKLSGSTQRVPLGSMGDGLKRLLALSLHLAQSAGGSLLIDEIDTGLHYSVMVRMWRLVIETARRLDIQVFATTHSLDCILALAELYEQAPELGGEVLLHRVERGEETPMTYTADELRVATAQHMEVR